MSAWTVTECEHDGMTWIGEADDAWAAAAYAVRSEE